MSDDIVAQLRAADEWMLVGLEGLAFSSNAPFEAADEITKLRADLAAEQDAHHKQCELTMRTMGRLSDARADLAAACELLREAQDYVADVPIAEAGNGLLARFDAFLKGDWDDAS